MSRILVPLDGSVFGERALVQAVELSRHTGAVLRLVHVWTPRYVVAGDFTATPPLLANDIERLDGEAYLDEVSRRLSDRSGLVVDHALLQGSPASAILEDIRSWGPDLIVMSTHGRTGWARAWIGSVADALIRQSRVPVFLVRPVHADGRQRETGLARSVLVPLNGTKSAERVLPELGKAVAPDARVTLMVVLTPVISRDALSGPLADAINAAAMPELREAQQGYLDAVAASLRTELPSAHIESRLAVDEEAAKPLIEAASAFDLVAIGTRAHTGPARLLLGSTLDKLLRGTDTNLLVLRRDTPDDRPDMRDVTAAIDEMATR